MKWSSRFHKSTVFNITVSGVFLALSLIFFVLSHQKFFTWPVVSSIGLKVDLSTLFILPIFVIANTLCGVAVLVIRFVLGPFIVPSASLDIDYFGNFILLFSSAIFIFLFLLLNKFIFKNEGKQSISTESQCSNSKKKLYKNLFLNLLCSTIVTSLLLTILNALFFTPVFFKLYKLTNNISPIDLAKKWNTDKVLKTFSLSLNYFLWAFVLYFPFNLVNFTVTSILFFGMYTVIVKNHSKLKKNFKY
ncbi:MPN527 family putative ECF transporter permease subunit [Mycoplasma sp. 1654_15]|uniref:MPN527 family putative ECF transporter permease subunit n=1 Tax=Mycoplasma sp. 1654_15 TaxID=2725994 RepID=UPI0014497988|nr:hypothetical protein [Mycoplasma sp. 1654_15]QJB71055.1 hypothetical protein HF996_00825 [Mycoplasma sp. 1654_15]